jgi:hypothetical protein
MGDEGSAQPADGRRRLCRARPMEGEGSAEPAPWRAKALPSPLVREGDGGRRLCRARPVVANGCQWTMYGPRREKSSIVASKRSPEAVTIW